MPQPGSFLSSWEEERLHRNSSSGQSSESTDGVYGDLPASFSGRSNRNYERLTRKEYEELEKEVLDYFDKKFYFRPPLQNWKLPEPSKMFVADKWKVSENSRILETCFS
jgi:hypothetical protein